MTIVVVSTIRRTDNSHLRPNHYQDKYDPNFDWIGLTACRNYPGSNSCSNKTSLYLLFLNKTTQSSMEKHK